MTIATYDPAKHAVSVAGFLIGGFGPDTFIVAERAEDTFSTQVGASGEVARTRNRNASGTITITLLASSLSNNVLSNLAQADELSGSGVGPFQALDINGMTVARAPNCWVQKLPNMERAKDLGVVEWVLGCDNLQMFLGGLTPA